MRRAATYGDGWIGYLLGPDSFARRRRFLTECREEMGRAGAAFTTGMLLPVHVDFSRHPHAAAAAAWTKLTDAKLGFPERLFVAGRPEEIVEQLHRYWELGCTEFVLAPTDQGGGYPDQVEHLAQEVLPLLRGFL
jgi:alkanesulfonate monooxygenase SsuD/methylene tetrahydromethanopterin reductase-like flavin-dependent oxidoreductase (luciferase family)